jgi:hypothetical protein
MGVSFGLGDFGLDADVEGGVAGHDELIQGHADDPALVTARRCRSARC